MLLDTHALLWLLTDDPRLGADARLRLATAPLLHASTISLWEVRIKADLGKLTVPVDFPERVVESGVEWLALTPEHVWASSQIQGLPHRDPFDKMLVAVSAHLTIPLLTADQALLSATISPAIELIDARA